MIRKIKFLKNQKNPSKFMLGYLLWWTGICKLITFSVKGIKFRFFKSVLSLNLFADRDYINDDFKYLDKYLNLGDTFIDIGANIGTWSTYASKLVGTKGKVLCFEPHPLMFKYLTGNIAVNDFKNILSFNVGCSDKDEELYFSNNYDTMNHITLNPENSIIVPVKELDNYTNHLERIDLLKIDVEGFELSVFKGATKSLQKTKKIIFESNETFQNKYNYKTSDILTLLNSAGFKVYRINEVGENIAIDNKYSSELGEDLIAIKV
jgi:FkbM family methyltransferase